MLLSIIAVLALGAVATAEPDAISTPPFVKLVHDSYLVPVSNSKCLLKPNKVVIGGGAAPYNVVYEFSSSLDDWGLIHNLSEPGHVDWLAGWNLQQYVGEPFRFRVTDALGAVAFDTPHELREATDADEPVVAEPPSCPSCASCPVVEPEDGFWSYWWMYLICLALGRLYSTILQAVDQDRRDSEARAARADLRATQATQTIPLQSVVVQDDGSVRICMD